MKNKQKIENLLKKLNEGVFEKEEVIALSLLTAVAGESIFLLGAPGVAKSLVARKLKYAFSEEKSFEYLMSRFSTPDEIFGPVSISKLKNEDKYERIVTNYLPSSTVVFLDEIWKAGPSIQNSLLTVLNEKIYRNGEEEIKVPLKALISASNELPSKGQGLEALWDRFLVRLVVSGIADPVNFNNMITKELNKDDGKVPGEYKITGMEYQQWSKEIDRIEVPENILNIIHRIRLYIDQHNQREENKAEPIYVSDRRWRKIARMLKTSAFLNGREAVDVMDCFLIKHCIWDDPKQVPAINQFVNEAIHKTGYTMHDEIQITDMQLKQLWQEVQTETTDNNNKTKCPHVAIIKQWNITVDSIRKNLQAKMEELRSIRSREYKDYKSNLFVNPAELHLIDTILEDYEAEIQKLKVETDRIKDYYDDIVKEEELKRKFK